MALIKRYAIQLDLAEFLVPTPTGQAYSRVLVDEILRFAGAVGVNESRTVLTVFCPAGLDRDAWAKLNVGRIRSFLKRPTLITLKG